MTTFQSFIRNPIDNAKIISVSKLEKYLRKLSALYYNTSNSPVSDSIFDTLKEILEERDPDNSFLYEVGAPIESNKVKLPFPMGSLDKIKPTTGELERWTKIYKGSYELSDKLDGISALLYKKDDVKLYSRGDGLFGQDITHLLKYVNIDLSAFPNNNAVRGELILSKKNFEKIKKDDPKIKNARNIVAGVVN